MPALVIDAGIEEDVVPDDLGRVRAARSAARCRENGPSGTARRRRRAGMISLSAGKSLEEIREDQLHERHRIGVEVVRARGVHRGVAAAADVDHRGHVELDELFVQRKPRAVGQRRAVEVAAGRVGVEVAARRSRAR